MIHLKKTHVGLGLYLAIASLLWPGFPGFGQDVPAELSDPDGEPGNPAKPVQVYILAGQSNMVGMGNLSGAKNVYSGVYYSSNPAVPRGPFQIYRVGHYKVSRLMVFQPDGIATPKPIAEGWLEAPQTGVYQLQCGSADRSYCEMKLDGQTVYSRSRGSVAAKKAINLQSGKRYRFRISGFSGAPPRFWMEKMDLLGNGDLEAVAKREGMFPWLVDRKGKWTVRNDVYYQEARLAKGGKGSPLSATSNGKSIGPELGFGHVLGAFHDEQVLLIKTAQGNRSLGFDFRPPTSGRTAPDNQFESAEYRLMVEGVRKTLQKIDSIVPNYNGQGYEIAGFVWFQGHKDSFSEIHIAEYEKNLVNLIGDIRREFKVPALPVVVATVGFGGQRMQEKFKRIMQAQLAVGDARKHPEFDGNVLSIDTRDFWREVDESPANQDYHYNRNAETYMRIGDSLGRAMVKLRGGKAEPLPGKKRSPHDSSQQKTTDVARTENPQSRSALKPIILDGIARKYVNNPGYSKSLRQEVSGVRPQRANQFLRGAMYGLLNCYHAAGITEYDWRPFGPNLDESEWEYFSFDPPEKLSVEKGNRYRKISIPNGMEKWNHPDFSGGKNGWKKGLQPFGQLDGKRMPLSDSCTAPFCRCGEKPKTLWEKEVLMVRRTLKIPPLKKGYRYRIVVGGAAHVNSGEGFALYANGKLLAESRTGVAVRQGGQPRGAHIYSDVRKEFESGSVTLSAISFLRYNHPRKGVQPPRGHFSLHIQEQKIPQMIVSSDE